MATNQVRRLLVGAARRVEQAQWGVAPYGLDLFTGCAAALDDAWVSPSTARARFTEDLAGVGSAVAGVFCGQGEEFWAEAGDEPVEVDPDDDRHGWKADRTQVRVRVAWRCQNPYWGW